MMKWSKWWPPLLAGAHGCRLLWLNVWGSINKLIFWLLSLKHLIQVSDWFSGTRHVNMIYRVNPDKSLLYCWFQKNKKKRIMSVLVTFNKTSAVCDGVRGRWRRRGLSRWGESSLFKPTDSILWLQTMIFIISLGKFLSSSYYDRNVELCSYMSNTFRQGLVKKKKKKHFDSLQYILYTARPCAEHEEATLNLSFLLEVSSERHTWSLQFVQCQCFMKWKCVISCANLYIIEIEVAVFIFVHFMGNCDEWFLVFIEQFWTKMYNHVPVILTAVPYHVSSIRQISSICCLSSINLSSHLSIIEGVSY